MEGLDSKKGKRLKALSQLGEVDFTGANQQMSASAGESQEGDVKKEDGETPEARDARIGVMADDFNTRARADLSKTDEIFREIRDQLAETDVEVFMQKVDALGWDEKDKVHETAVSEEHTELLPLGDTVKELKEKLGEPAGEVERIPYWILPDGDAVILSNGKDADVPKRPLRIGQSGYLNVKGKMHEYVLGAFREITDEEVKTRRTAMRALAAQPRIVVPTPESHPTGTEKGVVPEEAEAPETLSTEVPELRKEKPRTYHEAVTIFTRVLEDNPKLSGRAFMAAAPGLSKGNRKKLAEFGVNAKKVPSATMGNILHNYEWELNSKSKSESSAIPTPGAPMSRGSGERAPQAPKESSSPEAKRAELLRRIKENSDRIFGA